MNAVTPAAPAEPSLLNIIAAASRDDRVDIGKLTALIELQERVAARDAQAAYAEAMAAVAAELEPVKKDAKNPTYQRMYATLDAIDNALRPIYGRHGFSVSYGSEPAPPGHITITCTLAHRAGHSKTERMTAPLDLQQGGRGRTAVQAVGSTISYLRRYLITMAFNVSMAGEDDDGETTRRPPQQAEHGRRAAPPRPAPTHDDGDQVEYPFETAKGGTIYRTGSEWIKAWKTLVAACKTNGAMDKLQTAADMNQGAIAYIAEVDPLAAAEVRAMLGAALPEAEAHG